MRKHTIHDAMKVIRSRCEINEQTQCSEWQGYLTQKGYGRIRYDRNWTEVHRATWQYHNGPMPAGAHVLHKCDNRKCCAPSHLYLGTNEQNIQDKLERDRSGKSLNIAKATRIKELLAAGVSQASIAEEFGVGQPTISKIKMGKSWKHVGLPGGY